MILNTDIGLLGDAIGTIPSIIALSKYCDDMTLLLSGNAHFAKQIYDMIPRSYGIDIKLKEQFIMAGMHKSLSFDLGQAFQIAVARDLHMTQAHFDFFNLKTPPMAIKPELEFVFVDEMPVYDYVLAPFSRSLPEDQKWPQDNWNKLVDRMPDKKFVVFGNDSYDKRDFIFEKSNVVHMYSRPLNEVMSVMKKSRHGLLSVVTGISHFAYPLDVKSFLFNNQNMRWGTNPNATILKNSIHSYTPEQIEQIIR